MATYHDNRRRAMTLMDSLTRHPLGGDAPDDYVWECLMGDDASPADFVRAGRTLEAEAAEYVDWHTQQNPAYETTDADTGETETHYITPQDVCDLTAWIVRYVERATADAAVGSGART